VLFIWAGLVIGISFVEAPTKFTAPSLSQTGALDVGRVVFAMSHRVQFGLLVAAIACAWAAKQRLSRRAWILLASIVCVFAIQVLGVQPPLDARTARIIAGEALPPSHLHKYYVVLEVLKLYLLVATAWQTARNSSYRIPDRG